MSWLYSPAASRSLALISLGLLCAQFLAPHWWLGTPATVIFLWLIGRGATTWWRTKFSAIDAGLWASLSLAAMLITLTGIIYFFWSFNTTVALSLILFLTPFALTAPPFEKTSWQRLTRADWLGTLFALAGLTALIIILYTHRTTGVLTSPWHTLPTGRFLLLYALTTTVVLVTAVHTQVRALRYILTAAHILATYSVTLIMYPLGFGFDAFIHRATEQLILHQGSIGSPTVYIGQYVSVVWLTRLTGLPLFVIDVWFVPVLAALLLPTLVRTLFTRTGQFSDMLATNLVWIYPTLFFLWLGLTTPYNFALLLTLATVVAVWLYIHNHLPALAPLALAAATLVTHPLLGGPIFFLTLATIIIKKIISPSLSWTTAALYLVITALLPTALFVAFLLMQQQPLPTFTNPFTQIRHWVEIFRLPLPYLQCAPFGQLLFWFDRLIGTLIAFAALIGLARHRSRRAVDWLLPLTALGFVLGSWLLRSWVVFPEVGLAEQGDYPLRLAKASLLFIFPWAGLALGDLVRSHFIQKKINAARMIGLMFIVATLTTAFYISYPPKNSRAYNVTAADMAATAWIHADNQNYDYIVLSNPITAVAALSQYGFAKYFSTPTGPAFYYSIPSGGTLFAAYTKMYKEGPNRALMHEAMDWAGVRKSYFVINSYWAKFDATVAAAKKTADSWQAIDDGKIFIFTYRR